PWSLAFTDARTILVTERNGRLRMIRDGVLAPEPVWTSPTPPDASADSLHFVAIHPNFAQNQLVYVSYPKRGERGITLAVARGRLSGTKPTERISSSRTHGRPAAIWRAESSSPGTPPST